MPITKEVVKDFLNRRKVDPRIRRKVEKHLMCRATSELASFAGDLASARLMARDYPDLMQGEFPKHLAEALLEEDGIGPEGYSQLGDEPELTDEILDRHLPSYVLWTTNDLRKTAKAKKTIHIVKARKA